MFNELYIYQLLETTTYRYLYQYRTSLFTRCTVLARVHVWSILCPETNLCTYTCTFMVCTFPGDQLIKYHVQPSLPPTFRLRVPTIQNINLASPFLLVLMLPSVNHYLP